MERILSMNKCDNCGSTRKLRNDMKEDGKLLNIYLCKKCFDLWLEGELPNQLKGGIKNDRQTR